MKTLLPIFVGLAFATTAAFADSSRVTFDAANRAFAEHDYAVAIADYQTLIASRTISAPLFFNLGNAYAKTGDQGRAVASYMRAQLLAPADAAIARNLQSVVGQQPLRWFERASRSVSMNGWSIIGAVALTLFALAIASRLLGFRKRIAAALALSAGLSFVTSVAAIGSCFSALGEAVVLDETPARRSPFSAAEASFSLRPGTVVHTHEVHGEFAHITDAEGRSGWIPTAEYTRVIDPS